MVQLGVIALAVLSGQRALISTSSIRYGDYELEGWRALPGDAMVFRYGGWGLVIVGGGEVKVFVTLMTMIYLKLGTRETADLGVGRILMAGRRGCRSSCNLRGT